MENKTGQRLDAGSSKDHKLGIVSTACATLKANLGLKVFLDISVVTEDNYRFSPTIINLKRLKRDIALRTLRKK